MYLYRSSVYLIYSSIGWTFHLQELFTHNYENVLKSKVTSACKCTYVQVSCYLTFSNFLVANLNTKNSCWKALLDYLPKIFKIFSFKSCVLGKSAIYWIQKTLEYNKFWILIFVCKRKNLFFQSHWIFKFET